jgi:hypothetical protein
LSAPTPRIRARSAITEFSRRRCGAPGLILVCPDGAVGRAINLDADGRGTLLLNSTRGAQTLRPLSLFVETPSTLGLEYVEAVQHGRERPEVQGDRFEQSFLELITRVLENDLRLTILERVAQTRGPQRGKDLQIRWLDSDGNERFWQFECKSHAGKSLPTKEVADKLFQVVASSHHVDVWCLALANVEPSNELDDVIAAAPDNLSAEFALAVLSPLRGRLKRLYWCHPDLFRAQYPSEAPPTLTRRERNLLLEDFSAWLDAQQARKPASRVRLPTGWELVPRAGPPLTRNSSVAARRYLRGLTETCPWEAVAYNWAIERESVGRPLLAAVEQAPPGITVEWLVSAGGEGRSTALRRLAFEASRADEPARVLFARGEVTPVDFPTEWVDALPQDTQVVACVDGTRRFDGLDAALSKETDWTDRGLRIAIVLADRGNQWRRTRARLRLRRTGGSPRYLIPLSPTEQARLVGRLVENRLLLAKSPEQAAAELADATAGAARDLQRRRAERPWLLPTIMQLTDPAGRPFDDILKSVLLELLGDNEHTALRLLMAISLLHASGSALPQVLGARLVRSSEALTAGLAVIDAELERQFEVPLPARLRTTEAEFVTHGWPISDGFARVALSDAMLRHTMLEMCGALPAAMAQEYTPQDLLPRDRFDLLDLATDYLDEEVGDHEAAAQLLSGWVDLDAYGYPALVRLGHALLRSLQEELKTGADPVRARALLDASRAACREALRVVREVFAMPQRPTPYAGYQREAQEAIVFHNWATLEATVGTPRKTLQLGSRAELERALSLCVLCYSAGGEKHTRLALGLMAQVLINLDQFMLAGLAVAELEDLAGGENYVVRRCKRRLRSHRTAVAHEPSADELFAGIAPLTLDSSRGLGVAPTERGNREAITRALRRIAHALPSAPRLTAALRGQ